MEFTFPHLIVIYIPFKFYPIKFRLAMFEIASNAYIIRVENCPDIYIFMDFPIDNVAIVNLSGRIIVWLVKYQIWLENV